MTPQKFKRLLKDKKLITDKMDVKTVNLGMYRMCAFHLYDLSKEEAHFAPVSSWSQCRELFSRDLSPGKTFGISEYVPNTVKRNSWESDLKEKYTKLTHSDVFGKYPLIIGISSIEKKHAENMKKLINLVEEYNPQKAFTEILETKYVKNVLKINYMYTRPASSGDLYLFVVPNCWNISMPHLSFYLLLLRLGARQPIKKETLNEYVNRVRKTDTKDGKMLNKLLKREPNLIPILLRHWVSLKKTVVDWYRVQYENGIDKTTHQAVLKRPNIPRQHQNLVKKIKELMEKYKC